LNSWFPITTASYRSAFIAATTGCGPAKPGRDATYVSGLPCRKSPASTNTARPGADARIESKIVATRVSPRRASAESA
jgi:hypothetical protein